jgi:hypothetical protein
MHNTTKFCKSDAIWHERPYSATRHDKAHLHVKVDFGHIKIT